MNNVAAYFMVAVSLSLVLLLGCVFGFKLKSYHEKGSPFECGFDPSGVSRVTFCMKFFMISIIFLVFDVEVTLVFPMIYSMYQVLSFLLILMIGLVYEWAYGGLQWMV
uniref:NADH-ubiquinone oxidoreductase chain 3 n=1 Tax=Parasagitta elegans TaxID=1562708 RepID=A0A141CLW0_9BILA|nr:NADH dehydrogenase subunit 3 [Parasagitta elegans]